MGTGILAALSNFFSMVGGWFGYAKQRDAEKNTAAMQAGKSAQQEQAAVDKTNAAIASQEIKEVRNELAE